MSDYVFRGLEFDSLERLNVEVGDEIRATSVIDSARGRFSYELVLAADWTFRTIRVEAASGAHALELESDGKGEWTVDGEWRSDLDECIDIDISGTPFTNTLPIRRHPLGIGEGADFSMAWIDLADLSVFADPQRYTRLDQDRYRFDSLDSDFTADLTVDADGIIVDYPGLFERQ